MNRLEAKAGVFLLTVETFDQYEITEYYGMVTGQAVVGANFVKDFMASLSDLFGGRAGGYEGALRSAMDEAVLDMAFAAKKLGANAVIGIDVKGSAAGRMLLATCTGTAVELKPRGRE